MAYIKVDLNKMADAKNLMQAYEQNTEKILNEFVQKGKSIPWEVSVKEKIFENVSEINVEMNHAVQTLKRMEMFFGIAYEKYSNPFHGSLEKKNFSSSVNGGFSINNKGNPSKDVVYDVSREKLITEDVWTGIDNVLNVLHILNVLAGHKRNYSSDIPEEEIMKALGISKDAGGKSIVNLLKIVSSASKADEDNGLFSILGPGANYIDKLSKAYKEEAGIKECVDIMESSSGFISSIYGWAKYTENKDSYLAKYYGKKGIQTNVIAKTFGLSGAVVELFNGEEKGNGTIISNTMDIGSKGADLAGTIKKLKFLGDKAATKVVSSWITVAKTGFDTLSQAGKSYDKYNADGKVTFEEKSNIAIEASTKGLSTLISGVTLGIVNLDSDYISETLEKDTADFGLEVGKKISMNSEMQHKFRNGNPFEKMYAFTYGIKEAVVN